MAYVLKKITTDDPFTDHVIYYSKYLILNCITKNETRALESETKKSYINYQCYFYCDKGIAKWELFDSFTVDQLRGAFSGKYTETQLEKFAANKYIIPYEDISTLMDYMKTKMLEDYEELNDYYREIEGYRPSTSTVDIVVQDFGYANSDEEIHLHEADYNTLLNIDYYGVLDKIIAAYPEEKWIKNIKARVDGDNAIGYIQARQADNYDLLYVPDVDDSQMKEEFITKYTNNREYVLNCVYSDAFKLGSDYYDNFIQVLILVLTMIDMLDGIQDHIVRKDIIDVRCIQYIFEQYSIPYYDEIPIKYQVAMMKNIHKLLKFKSTARCMIDLCSLFGFPSSEIFQLYLMKDRKLDANGNYIFNYITKKTPIEVGKVEKIIETFDMITDNSINLNFPIANFFDNGNLLEVWLDDKLLSDEFYTIYENTLYFENINILQDVESIKVKYYYDLNTEDLDDIEGYKILKQIQKLTFHPDTNTYELELPIDNFFEQGGIIKIIHGTLLLPESAYDVNVDDNTITFVPKFLESNAEDKYMEFIYFYSSTLKIKNQVIAVEVTENKQTSIQIPEPYPEYYASGSRFFVSVGGTYITSDRYHVVDNTLIMNSSDEAFEQGQHVFFHFVYTDLGNIEIITSKQTVIATKNNQREFDIPLPYPSYLDEGNPMFVRVRGSYLLDKYYTVSKNVIHLSPNHSVYEQGAIEFIFIYPTSRSIKHSTTILTASNNYQQDFHFEYPYPNFFSRGNKLKVVYDGIVYVEDVDYVIKGDRIEILTIEKSLNMGDELRLEFYFNEENENIITIHETQAKIITDDQKRFSIEVPFYRYFRTGNEMIVTIGSTYVSPSDYTISGNTLIFTDDHVVELAKDRMINFTFIYHTIYNKYNTAIHKEGYSYDIIDTSGDHLKLPIPYPFENYIELGNEFEIRLDGEIVLDPDNYEILNNEYVLIRNAKELIYDEHSSIQFVFIYSCIGFEYDVSEDIERDCELKFIKVPILEAPEVYFKEPEYYVKYDDVALHDETWNGEYVHEHVKKAILYRDFNYTRTKYFSIVNLISMCQISYQVPYFMNIILDNIKLEESLVLKVPYINNNTVFKFNDIITFMMALSHRYMGVDDGIPTIAKALYIKGFNFEADMSALASYISQKLGSLSNEQDSIISNKYKAFKFIEGRIPTYKELINIYTTNTEIYDHVVHEMLNADNKMIFDIYKKIYESLMIIKESKQYFNIGRTQAKSLTEWLKYRNLVLYDHLMKIDQIEDETQKKKSITECLEACNYEIEQFIDADVFKYFLASFSGNDADSLTRYLRLVINFFKSYKIQLYDVSTHYLIDDKLENTIRAIDQIYYTSTNNLGDEGHNTFDILSSMTILSLLDSKTKSMIREKVELYIREYTKLLEKDVMKTPELLKYLISMIVKDKVLITGILKYFSEISLKERLEDWIDDFLAKWKSSLTFKEYSTIREYCIVIAKKYLELEKKDYASIIEDLNLLDLQFPEEDINSQIIEDVKVKVLLLAACSDMSGIDQVVKLRTLLTLYETTQIQERVSILEKIYTVLSKLDKVYLLDDSVWDSIHNLNEQSSIKDTIKELIHTQPRDLLTKDDTISSTQITTILKDIYTMQEQVKVLFNELRNLTDSDTIEVLDESVWDSINHYNDRSSIKDTIKELIHTQPRDLLTKDDTISSTQITTILKDIYTIQEQVKVLFNELRNLTNSDTIEVFDQIQKYFFSQHFNDRSSIRDTFNHSSHIQHQDSITQDDALLSTQIATILKDIYTMQEQVKVLLNELRNLTDSDTIEIFDQIQKYILSYHYNEQSSIKDTIKELIHTQPRDLLTKDDTISSTQITTILKDIHTIQEQVKVLFNELRNLTDSDTIEILDEYVWDSINHYNDQSSIRDTFKHSSHIQHQDSITQDDALLSTQITTILKDIHTIQEQVKVLRTSKQTMIFKDLLTILTDMFSYSVSFQSKEDIILIEKILLYLSYNSEDLVITNDIITNLKAYLQTSDKITFKEYLKLTITDDDKYSRIYKIIMSIEEFFDYTVTMPVEDLFADILDSLSKSSISLTIDDDLYIRNHISKFLSFLVYKDSIPYKDYLESLTTKEVVYLPPIQDSYKIHDSLILKTID